jgi:DNA-binding NtrC family response regulator
MALEATLDDVGIPVAGPFGCCSEALAWIVHQTPAVAILDYKLKDGPCTELVKALLARNVPVIIYSGQPKGWDTPLELRGLTWLEKPTDRADLLAAMARLAPSLFDSIGGVAPFRRTAPHVQEAARTHAQDVASQ